MDARQEPWRLISEPLNPHPRAMDPLLWSHGTTPYYGSSPLEPWNHTLLWILYSGAMEPHPGTMDPLLWSLGGWILSQEWIAWSRKVSTFNMKAHHEPRRLFWRHGVSLQSSQSSLYSLGDEHWSQGRSLNTLEQAWHYLKWLNTHKTFINYKCLYSRGDINIIYINKITITTFKFFRLIVFTQKCPANRIMSDNTSFFQFFSLFVFWL
jgi:hypothetical protein